MSSPLNTPPGDPPSGTFINATRRTPGAHAVYTAPLRVADSPTSGRVRYKRDGLIFKLVTDVTELRSQDQDLERSGCAAPTD